jgi:hypothetical protein
MLQKKAKLLNIAGGETIIDNLTVIYLAQYSITSLNGNYCAIA